MLKATPRTTRHAGERPLTHGSWRRVGTKIACAGACALMVGQLLLPSVALAAEWVNIDGNQYDTAANGTGWAWDGGDNLDLNDYIGSGIYAQGDLTIDATGSNIIYSDGDHPAPDGFSGTIDVNGGDLTIKGDGGLYVAGEYDVINASASVDDRGTATGGDITIDGVQLTVDTNGNDDKTDGPDGKAAGIQANGGDLTVRNGAKVDVRAGTIPNQTVGYKGSAWSSTGISVSNKTQKDGADRYLNKGGNITIEGADTAVNVLSFAAEDARGVVSEVHNAGPGYRTTVVIRGGAFVNVLVRVSASEGWDAYGIESRALGDDLVTNIDIDGKETRVSIDAKNEDPEAPDTYGYGLIAISSGLTDGGGINVNSGTVRAEGAMGAMLAINRTTKDGAAATISLGKGAVVSPDGTVIRDYWEEIGMPMSLDAVVWANGYKGQTFGSVGEGVLNDRSSEIAEKVEITFKETEPDTPVTPEDPVNPTDPTTPPSGNKTDNGAGKSAATIKTAAAKTAAPTTAKFTTGALAKTGDDTLVSAAALGIAGVIGIAAAVVVTRKR